MAIEKGVYSAPQGLDEEAPELEGAEELEIEIVDPEAVTLSDGSMEITIIPDPEISDFTEFGMNLAEVLDDGHLREISDDLSGLIESDIDQPLPLTPLSAPANVIELVADIVISAACAEDATNAVPNAVNPTFFRLFILFPFVNC